MDHSLSLAGRSFFVTVLTYLANLCNVQPYFAEYTWGEKLGRWCGSGGLKEKLLRNVVPSLSLNILICVLPFGTATPRNPRRNRASEGWRKSMYGTIW